MRLTPGQLDWLQHAQRKGYEQGFWAPRYPSLLALERKGLIEHNPCTGAARLKLWEWRVTQKGLDVKLKTVQVTR